MTRSLLPLLLLLVLATPSAALTLDFYDGLGHGDVVLDGSMDFGSYSVTVSNPNRAFDLGVVFDTDTTGTADSDLEFGSAWAGGNLAGESLGNILILQENPDDCATGTCSRPDDEATRPFAGSWVFDFDDSYQSFGIDLVDFGDDGPAGAGTISFLDGASTVATFQILDLASLFSSQNLEFGNRNANRISFSSDAIGGAFDGIRIELFGSGGIDGLQVSNADQVPEPGTMGLVGLGLVGLALRSRRRFA